MVRHSTLTADIVGSSPTGAVEIHNVFHLFSFFLCRTVRSGCPTHFLHQKGLLMKNLGWYGVVIFILMLVLAFAIDFGISFAVTWLFCKIAGIAFKWLFVWLVFFVIMILSGIFKGSSK